MFEFAVVAVRQVQTGSGARFRCAPTWDVEGWVVRAVSGWMLAAGRLARSTRGGDHLDMSTLALDALDPIAGLDVEREADADRLLIYPLKGSIGGGSPQTPTGKRSRTLLLA